MVRTFLIICICIVAVLTASRFISLEKPPVSQIPQEFQAAQEHLATPVEIPPIILALNERNQAITSFTCDQITVKTWERGARFRLTAKMHYEKQQRFRMLIQSAFGTEVDLGSNDRFFWYWSRRDPKPGLYWANHEDYYNTRLKTPFDPMFMQDTLGLNQIDLKDVKIGETDRVLIVTSTRVNALAKQIIYNVFINKTTAQVEAIMITDTSGTPLVVTEIERREDGLPTKVTYSWFEENRTLGMEFENPRINVPMSENLWLPPDHKPVINMGEE